MPFIIYSCHGNIENALAHKVSSPWIVWFESLRSEVVVIERKVIDQEAIFFVDGRHENPEIHIRTNFHLLSPKASER